MLVCALFLTEGLLAIAPHVYLLGRRTSAPTAGSTWLIFAGDSVTAGYGGPKNVAFPALIGAQLLGAGNTDYGVYNVALDAAGAPKVLWEVEDALDQVPAGVQPVVMVMVGHNDLTRWSGNMGIDPGSATDEGPQGIGGGPRLLRLLRWFEIAARGETQHVRAGPEWEASFELALGRIQTRVARAGGRMYLETYAVPGIPDDTVSRFEAIGLLSTRRAQIDVNKTIRLAGEVLRLPLIDVERTADIPAAYESGLFIDNIHLSAEGHRRVMRSVRDALVMYGELPPALYGTPAPQGR